MHIARTADPMRPRVGMRWSWQTRQGKPHLDDSYLTGQNFASIKYQTKPSPGADQLIIGEHDIHSLSTNSTNILLQLLPLQ